MTLKTHLFLFLGEIHKSDFLELNTFMFFSVSEKSVFPPDLIERDKTKNMLKKFGLKRYHENSY
jgi:hypothetical protein